MKFLEKYKKRFHLDTGKSNNISKSKKFKDLDELINSGESEIILDSDYILGKNEDYTHHRFQDAKLIRITSDNITIDGKGHVIDARKRSCILEIEGKNITLKNIVFRHAYCHLFSAVLHVSLEGSCTVENCHFENNAADNGSGIENDGSLKLDSCTIHSNNNAPIKNNNKLELINCKFIENHSSHDNSCLVNGGNAEIKNCMFRFNKSSLIKSSGFMDISKCGFIENEQGTSINNMGELKLTKSKFKNNRTNYSLIKNNEKLDMESCEFTNNSSKSDGGAISNDNIMSLNNCRFIENTSQSNGGAIYCNKESMDMNNCEFKNNTATEGGAIYSKGEITLNDCEFINNVSYENGGAISCFKESSNEICNTQFISNNSKKDCGGIYNQGKIILNDSTFKSNVSMNNGGGLGNFGDMDIYNTEFLQNKCENNGGGIHNNGKLAIDESHLCNNFSKNNGGAIDNTSTGSVEISNTELIGNDSKNACGINNDSYLKLFKVKIERHEREEIILNNAVAECINTSFEKNAVNSLIKNERGKLSVMGCTLKDNLVKSSSICNTGHSCSIADSKFENTADYEIINENNMLIQNLKFNTPEDKTILNLRYLEIKKLTNELENRIEDMGTVEIISYDPDYEYDEDPEDGNLNNFTRLDELIHGNELEINLNEDFSFLPGDSDFYEGGIELDIDNLTIDGHNITLDGKNKSRAFYITAKNVTLKNLIFKNGKHYTDFSKRVGGGGSIYIAKNSSLNLINCEFIDNFSNDKAGAILNNGTLKSEKCKFINNKSDEYGGAVYNSHIHHANDDTFEENKSKIGNEIFNNGELNINGIILRQANEDSIFNNGNVNIDRDYIYNTGYRHPQKATKSFSYLKSLIDDSNSIRLETDILFDNEADKDLREGIILKNKESLVIDGNGHLINLNGKSTIFCIYKCSNITIKNIIFKNAYCDEKSLIELKRYDYDITFENCHFINNRAINNFCIIDNKDGDLTIKNSIFSNNTSNKSLIQNEEKLEISDTSFLINTSQNDGGTITNLKKMNIDNCIFKGNLSKYRGGAIYNDKQSTSKIRDTQFIRNNSGASTESIFCANEDIEIMDCKFNNNLDFKTPDEWIDNCLNNPSWIIRLEALDHIHNTETIEKAALNDPQWQVRLAAVKKANLTDESLLNDIAENDKCAQVSMAAAERLNDEYAFFNVASNHTEDREIFLKAAKNIKNNEYLKEILTTHPDSLNSDQYYIRDILDFITDENVLIEILNDEKLRGYHSLAVRGVKNEEILTDILKGYNSEQIKSAALKNIENERILSDIAINDMNETICKNACEKINTESLLIDIASKSDKYHVRRTAIEKIHSAEVLKRIATGDKDPFIRSTACENINDEKTLISIYHENREFSIVRDKVVKHPSVTNKAFLAEVLKNDSDENTRISAISKITDEDLLKFAVENDLSYHVREIAVRRIDDEETLFQVASNDPSQSVICLAITKIENEDYLNELVKHENNFARKEVIKNKNFNNERILSQLALNDPEFNVRKTATQLTTDEETLMQIALNDPIKDIRILACENDNLKDEATLIQFLKNDDYDAIEGSITKKINNEDLIVELIKSKASSPSLFILLKLVRKITSEDKLIELFDDSRESIREEVIRNQNLHDQSIIKKACCDTSADVRKIAITRVNEKRILEYISQNDENLEIRKKALKLMNFDK